MLKVLKVARELSEMKYIYENQGEIYVKAWT